MRTTALLLIVLCASIGCVEQQPETETTASVEHFSLESDEVFYVRAASGVVELTATEPFDRVEFHVSLSDTQLRVLDAAGEPLVDWAAASSFVEDSDPASFAADLELDTLGATIQLRSSNLEFGRVVVGVGPVIDQEGDTEIPEGAAVPFVARAGRWIPPDDILAVANQQYLPYTGAPSSCSGSLRAGTREVAEFLKREFVGATSYGGYACRRNTANTSVYSVHASGRAIDLFVPLDGGEADNDLGDPIAHYLIMNAQQLGIEFIVWDRTSWGAHRAAPKHRAYTGPHPHHDHLHIELSPTSSSTTGRTFPSTLQDTPPVGYLDVVDCEKIAGWAQDPDAPDQAIPVYISIGGPVFTPGAFGYTIDAWRRRDDLCTAIGSCDHGYELPVPRGLMDGVAREVHVYGMDVTGPTNSALGAAPKILQCEPAKLPYESDYGVRRHVTSPTVMAAWAFDWNDIATFDDATLETLPEVESLPEAPSLIAYDGAVYVVDGNVRRHVPDPAAMVDWGFGWGSIVAVDNVDDLMIGPPLAPRPFLARGSGPAVYLIEPPTPLWADELSWMAPDTLGRRQDATATLSLRNRGATTWQPELFELRGCDGTLDAPVESTQTTTIDCSISGAADVGTEEFCYQLVHDGFEFGPPICFDIDTVTDPVDLEFGPRPVDLDEVEEEEQPNVMHGRVGCSSTDAGASPWALLLMSLVFARRRRNAVGERR